MSVSLQRLICPLCLYVVAFGHVFEVLRGFFSSPPAFLYIKRRQCSGMMKRLQCGNKPRVLEAPTVVGWFQ